MRATTTINRVTLLSESHQHHKQYIDVKSERVDLAETIPEETRIHEAWDWKWKLRLLQ